MKWIIMFSLACLQHFIPMELRAEKQKMPETDRIGLGETSAITRTRIWRAECGINYSWAGSSLNEQKSISFPIDFSLKSLREKIYFGKINLLLPVCPKPMDVIEERAGKSLFSSVRRVFAPTEE